MARDASSTIYEGHSCLLPRGSRDNHPAEADDPVQVFVSTSWIQARVKGTPPRTTMPTRGRLLRQASVYDGYLRDAMPDANSRSTCWAHSVLKKSLQSLVSSTTGSKRFGSIRQDFIPSS